MDLAELNELTEFLRQRAGEDVASGGDLRRARGRAISMLVGQAGNVPESFQMELRWLAANYAGHPDCRPGWPLPV